MEKTITKEKEEFIKSYIYRLEQELSEFDNINDDCSIIDTISEIVSVFKNELPELRDSLSFKDFTVKQDAKKAIGILKKYLIDNGCKIKTSSDSKLSKFWTSFITYFESNDVAENF